MTESELIVYKFLKKIYMYYGKDASSWLFVNDNDDPFFQQFDYISNNETYSTEYDRIFEDDLKLVERRKDNIPGRKFIFTEKALKLFEEI